MKRLWQAVQVATAVMIGGVVTARMLGVVNGDPLGLGWIDTALDTAMAICAGVCAGYGWWRL